MTTTAEAYEAVRERWASLWPAASSGCPYAHDNEVYRPPEDGSRYALLSIVDDGGRQATFGPPGSRRYRREGRVVATVLTPADQGRSATDDLVAAAREVFEGARFGGVNFYAEPSALLRSAQVSGRYWTGTVELPFFYHETR